MDLTCSAHSDTIGYTKEAHMSVKDRSPVGVDGNPSKPLIPGIGSPLDLRGETVFDHPYKPRFDALPGTAPGGTVRPGLPAQPSEPSLQTKRRKALFQFAALTGAVAAGTGIGLALAGNNKVISFISILTSQFAIYLRSGKLIPSVSEGPH